MAKTLGVSRSGYYAWLNRKPSRHEQEDRELLARIVKIFEEHKGRYGSPRIWRELIATYSRRISRKRVERIMKEHGLQAQRKRKPVYTTDSRHTLETTKNLLNRNFTAVFPGEKWVSDITYLATREGFLYLTVILDLWDRSIVGWHIGETMDAETVCKALRMAVTNRRPRKGLLFHSDRGVQYCSELFCKTLTAYCPYVKRSMSRKGNCWDNACAESFFKTLKRELTILTGKYSKREVRTGVFEYIETYYNRRRRHSALGYATPLAYIANVA